MFITAGQYLAYFKTLSDSYPSHVDICHLPPDKPGNILDTTVPDDVSGLIKNLQVIWMRYNEGHL